MTAVLNGKDLGTLGENLCEKRKKSFILVDLLWTHFSAAGSKVSIPLSSTVNKANWKLYIKPCYRLNVYMFADNGIGDLIKETPEKSLTSSTTQGYSEKMAIYEPGTGRSPDTKSTGTSILDFRIHVCL